MKADLKSAKRWEMNDCAIQEAAGFSTNPARSNKTPLA